MVSVGLGQGDKKISWGRGKFDREARSNEGWGGGKNWPVAYRGNKVKKKTQPKGKLGAGKGVGFRR